MPLAESDRSPSYLAGKLREYADLRSTPDELSRLLWQAAEALEHAGRYGLVRREPSMWATVTKDSASGSIWDCHTEGDQGDGDSLFMLTLAADTFPPGTIVEITEPRAA